MSITTPRTSLVLGTFVALFASLTPSAGAGATQPALEGPGVVYFPSAPEHELSNSEIFIIQGTPTPDGGCLFNGSLTLNEGDAAIAEHEIARQESTCRSLVERGTPTAPPPAPSNSDAAEPSGGDETFDIVIDPDSTASSDPSANANRIRKKIVTGYVYHEDPVGYNVTELWDQLTWRPSPTCASAGKAAGRVRDDWFEPTGWSRFVRQSTADARCNRVKLNTNAIYENRAFCNPFSNTLVSYRPNQVLGYRDGLGAEHRWSETVGGDCGDLLSFHHSFYRGKIREE